ncbi:MAG: glycosyltransferase family 39 protein [Mucilaginibacter sp.]|uniref:ArnT family glycosyltransferase n=1 Tax=Mucilaginibacter sp. TaxID=1882438 RepID=UPI0032632F5A
MSSDVNIFKNSEPLKFNILYVILFLAVLQLFIALFTNGFLMSADEAMWHYIGRNWFRNGLIPYSTGGIDNKSPLIFAIFGLSDKLFGINYWFPRVLGTICQSVGIYCVYKIATHFANKQTGLFAVLFYGLSVLWHCADGKYVSYTETYEILFITIAFYTLLIASNKRGFFLSGVLSAFALGFRQSAAFGIVPMFITAFRKGWVYSLNYCLGLLVGTALLIALCWLVGIDIHKMLFYTFADNYGPGSTTDHVLMWRMEQFFNMFLYSELVLFYPLVLGYIFINRKADWLIIWLVVEFLGICIVGNYARVHLKEMLPPISIISALTLSHLINVYQLPSKPVLAIVFLCFFPRLLEPLVNLKKLLSAKTLTAEQYCREPFTQPEEEACKKLGQWVKANTPSTEKVLVAGYGAQVQVYTERLSPSVFFNATQQTEADKKVLFKDIDSHKPGMILIPLFPEYTKYVDAEVRQYLANLVAKEYDASQCLYNYTVYQIKQNGK